MSEFARQPVAGRIFLIALCGGGDRPDPALGGRTSFEAAATPHLDRLATAGVSGLLDVIGERVPPESDSGAMALLGYDPLVHYTGRGPLEGLGMGFLEAGGGYCAAFRINFASARPGSGELDRRTSRDLSDAELAVLVEELLAGVTMPAGVTLRLTGFGRHRGILAFTSGTVPLSGQVSNTDPGFVNRGAFGIPVNTPVSAPLEAKPLVDDDAAGYTAMLVNDFVRQSGEILRRSEVNEARTRAGRRPANTILVRDGGSRPPRLPGFAAGKLALSMYGQVPAERGLAGLIGGRFTTARTGPGQTDPQFYQELVPAVLADPADVVFVHLKGPDEPGHDGRPADKVRAISEIDAGFVGPLADRLTPADTLVVTCDHATPCALGIHSADQVPAVVFGSGVRPDAVTAFGEGPAARGALPVQRAKDLLGWLISVRTTA
ncbi:CMP-5'-phosphonoformate--3-phosphoglycerate phosphonoformyl transferase [Actinoplanes sp. NPDC048967]|uniref:CMP-5'-phosphonoformate--3-phosphoglycerate phosphonoformyl transferase n=1 Tax=Actinoplanes sp. NPDC048967 TaxID=3155269 RepID=UPI0033D086A8